MPRFDDRIDAYLDSLRAAHGFRTMKPGRPEGARLLWRQGRRLVNFSSNNYLGLTHHPEVIRRTIEWTESFGAGSGASRLVTGTYEAHAAVEEKLARLKGTEAALVFNSGYQANSAIMPAIFSRTLLGGEPTVYADELIHASMHHGLRSSGIEPVLFRHNDLGHLEELLGSRPAGPAFVVTETVFSMDGDTADVPAMADLSEKFDAFLYLDEAHATGAVGPKGMGLSGEAPGRVDLVMGTFSKALGSFGAYVCCSRAMRDYLVNRCKGFVYTTALPPGVLGAMDAALDLVPEMDEDREHLHALAQRLRDGLAAAGLDTAGSSTQIVPALIGGEAETLAASERLEEAGILGVAIRPPTVPRGTSRIRFAVTAAHFEADVDTLIQAVTGEAS